MWKLFWFYFTQQTAVRQNVWPNSQHLVHKVSFPCTDFPLSILRYLHNSRQTCSKQKCDIALPVFNNFFSLEFIFVGINFRGITSQLMSHMQLSRSKEPICGYTAIWGHKCMSKLNLFPRRLFIPTLTTHNWGVLQSIFELNKISKWI